MAFVFYGLNLLLCLFVKYTSWFHSYDQMFWMELILAMVAIAFAYFNKNEICSLLAVKQLRFPIIVVIMLSAIVTSWLVNISIRELNISLFKSDNSYYGGYQIYIAPQLVMIYSIALMPAIFEELAFRGILYQYLSSILHERMVVLVTACMFAALHLNFLSLIWLLPFGIFVGFLRRKYNTIWYGIIFHFVFNLTACLMDLQREGHLF